MLGMLRSPLEHFILVSDKNCLLQSLPVGCGENVTLSCLSQGFAFRPNIPSRISI
jgi:hypothetical protein